MSPETAESRGPQYTNPAASATLPPASAAPAPTTPATVLSAVPLPVNRAGQMLAAFLAEHDYHPVVLCGTAQAGKTTMLASLCAFLRTSGVASFDFGEWYDPGDSAEANEQLAEAQRFFRIHVKDFIDGMSPEATHFPLPYIVPLIVTPTTSSLMHRGSDGQARPVKFAVMDMRGEFFKPDPLSAINRPMHAEAQALLQTYERGVSMIYLAPTTRIDGYATKLLGQLEPHQTEDADTRFQEDPDEALMNAIKSYERMRPTRAHDRHLYLLTKWDLHTHGTEPANFAAPSRHEVEGLLRRKYGSSWAAFRALRAARGSKWFVQYSAGIISGRAVIKQQADSLDRLERYSKVLWNWLYQSATRTADQREGHLLFPDVVPRPPSPLFKWLTGWTGARH